MKALKFLAVAALVGLTFTGCCRACRTQPARHTEDRLRGVTWSLIRFDGKSVVADGKYQLVFDSGRISGIGECNRYFGPYEVLNSNGGIRMGPVASTMMACLGDNFEPQYFKMFEKITLYQFDGDKLYLFHGDTPRAVFKATAKALE